VCCVPRHRCLQQAIAGAEVGEPPHAVTANRPASPVHPREHEQRVGDGRQRFAGAPWPIVSTRATSRCVDLRAAVVAAKQAREPAIEHHVRANLSRLHQRGVGAPSPRPRSTA
jgi:hypothetical protein